MNAKFTINGQTVEITEIDVQQIEADLYQAAVYLTVNGQTIGERLGDVDYSWMSSTILFQDDVNDDGSRAGEFALGNEFEVSCRPLYRQLLNALGADEDPDADSIAEQLIALPGFDCLIAYVNEQIKTQTAHSSDEIMTAFDLHQAAFDSACDYAEETIEYITQYADGALDLFVSSEVAQKILDCRREWRESGYGANNFYNLVREPLEEIQL